MIVVASLLTPAQVDGCTMPAFTLKNEAPAIEEFTAEQISGRI
jgi:hypothetical protein